MQKFTRPITREVEIGGERLAFTFGEQGITVRPVGSRKPPKEISWATLLTHMTSSSAAAAGPDQGTAAPEHSHAPGSKPGSQSEPEESPAPSTVSPTAPPP